MALIPEKNRSLAIVHLPVWFICLALLWPVSLEPAELQAAARVVDYQKHLPGRSRNEAANPPDSSSYTARNPVSGVD